MHSMGILMVCTRKLKYEISHGPTLFMRITFPLSGLSGEDMAYWEKHPCGGWLSAFAFRLSMGIGWHSKIEIWAEDGFYF